MVWRERPSASGQKPEMLERIIAGSCYLSAGLIGLLYIVIKGRDSQSNFFRFHFLQSIFLGIMFLLLQWTADVIVQIGSGLMGLFQGFAPAVAMYGPWYLGQGLGWLLKGYVLVIAYGMIFAFLGKYAEIWWVSGFIRQKM